MHLCDQGCSYSLKIVRKYLDNQLDVDSFQIGLQQNISYEKYKGDQF